MTEREMIEVLCSPNGPEEAKKKGAGTEEVLALLNKSEEAKVQAAALSFLVREGKTKAGREAILRGLPKETLQSLILSKDAKVRKNAARLAGATVCRAMDEVLAKALLEEGVRMVRPSQILALGALKTDTAKKVLENYQVPPAADTSEKKHAAEETEALRKALAGWIAVALHAFTGLQPFAYPKVRCRLVAGRGFEEALAEEIRTRNAADEILRVAPGSVTVEGTDWERLQQVRSYREILIPLMRETVEMNERAPKLLAEALFGAMKAMHEGEPPYRFRLEMGKTGAGVLAPKIEAASEGKLLNAPGNYECELRLVLSEKGRAHAYLKLFTAQDRRFAYRKQSIPASIHPSAAAGVMWLVKPYLKKNATVLDPCCGSGTLLYERAFVPGAKPSGMIGSDISAKALEAARANESKGMPHLTWIHRDLSKLELREKADEVFANLPFGNRVGSHEINLALYHELVIRIPDWVKPGGIAVLYTMEGRLLEKELRSAPNLKIMRKTMVEAGGLQPVVFVIRVS